MHFIDTGQYIIVPEGEMVHVILHKSATPQDHLQAYVHALFLADLLSRNSSDSSASEAATSAWMQTSYHAFLGSVSQIKLSHQLNSHVFLDCIEALTTIF